MPLSNSAEPLDPIEQDFMNALQRLLDGNPCNHTLKASLKKKGKLSVNALNVALEAGHSRTLISMDKCRYPKVREAIRLAKGGKAVEPSTYTQLIQNLRTNLAQAKAENKLLQLQIGVHFTARMTAEENAMRLEKVVAQLRKELLAMHKVASFPSKEIPPSPRLVLIRGLPGSGKTTRAQFYKKLGYEHFEADMFFDANGEYAFVEEKLPEAHAWCLKQTSDALASGAHVVVANVFAGVSDIKPYVDLGFDYEVVETTGGGKSSHGVSSGVTRGIKAAWVPTDGLIRQLKQKVVATSNVTLITGKK